MGGSWDSRAVYRGVLRPCCMFSSEQRSQKTLFLKDKDSVKHRTRRSELHKSATANMYFESSFMSVDAPGC